MWLVMLLRQYVLVDAPSEEHGPESTLVLHQCITKTRMSSMCIELCVLRDAVLVQHDLHQPQFRATDSLAIVQPASRLAVQSFFS